MMGRRTYLQEDTQFRVMRLLHENSEISQRELAKAVGISIGGAHYVITAPLEKGWIKLNKFSSSKDKRRYAYILTPKGISKKSSIAKRFLARKMKEYEALRAEIEKLSQSIDRPNTSGTSQRQN